MNWELISSIMMTTLPADHPTATGTSPAPRVPAADLALCRGSEQGPPDSPSAPQEAGGEAMLCRMCGRLGWGQGQAYKV